MLTALFGQASVGRYAIIGMSGVVLDTLLFIALTHAGVVPVAATVLSTPAGIVNNYFLNARFNFRASPNIVHLLRFVTVGLIGLGVAAATLELLIASGLTPLPAKLLSLPCVLACQFLANRYWTFRNL